MDAVFFLSKENKRNCVVDSEAILALFRRNPDEFLRRNITGYMGKGQMISGAYYASLFPLLSGEVKKKRPHLIKIVLHQENAWVHTCAVSMAKIVELKFELL